MPLISIWPVSLSIFTMNVGSSRCSMSRTLASLSLSAARLRLDSLADDRLGERDLLQQDRVLRVAERVAGDRVLQADDGDDVARRGVSGTSSQLRRVGVDVVQLADVLLDVLARVVDAACSPSACRNRRGRRTGRPSLVATTLNTSPQNGSLGSGLRFSSFSFFGLVPTTGGRSSGLGR